MLRLEGVGRAALLCTGKQNSQHCAAVQGCLLPTSLPACSYRTEQGEGMGWGGCDQGFNLPQELR